MSDKTREGRLREGGVDAVDAVDAVNAVDAVDAVNAVDAAGDVVALDGSDARRCERAPTLGVGTIEGIFSGATQPVARCAATDGSRRPALFGRVTVPARQMLRVVSSIHGVSLFEGCDTERCLPASYGTHTTTFLNARDEARTITVAITEALPGLPIPASLRVELVATHPEDLCALAPELSASAAVTLDPGPAVDTRPLCGTDRTPPTSFVRVRVRAGERLVAHGADSVLRLFGDCDARACLSSAHRDSLGGWLAWTNELGAERGVVLAVSARGPGGPRAITLSLGPPPSTSRCDTAPAIPDGLSVLDPAAAGIDLVCGAMPLAHWHRATVPPGHRIRLEAAADLGAPVVYLQDSCGATRCALDADQWRGDRANTVIWDNRTPQPRALRIATVGALSLRAALGPNGPLHPSLRRGVIRAIAAAPLQRSSC